MEWATGYCTNVHAGAGLVETRQNLERYALAVKAQIAPEQPLGVGLWLSAQAARALRGGDELPAFKHWLDQVGLVPYTLNGFPYGDFHQKIVKHLVYTPTWCETARADYTRDLIAILDALLPAGAEGSISTLPIAWGEPTLGDEQSRRAAELLFGVAETLADLESRTGRLIYLCLEPEPGCVYSTSRDLVAFFDRYLFARHDRALVARYLRVCHDVCHAAVMFEGQREVLDRYRAAGVAVGKVQVSSAVRLDFESIEREDRPLALKQLQEFAEDRYLHQTMARDRDGRTVFYEDLPQAIAAADPRDLAGEWRVHFHVPIYLERFGWLEAMQGSIRECLAVAPQLSDVQHYEVETYAWGVLPRELRQPDLATGIAEELRWLTAAQQTLPATGG